LRCRGKISKLRLWESAGGGDSKDIKFVRVSTFPYKLRGAGESGGNAGLLRGDYS